MKDAVIKTEQYDMKILELTPDLMRVSVADNQGENFNFVPRFLTVVYPDNKTITAKDAGAVVVRRKETVQVPINFSEKLRIEMFASFELRYARRKLATISIE